MPGWLPIPVPPPPGFVEPERLEAVGTSVALALGDSLPALMLVVGLGLLGVSVAGLVREHRSVHHTGRVTL